MNQPPGEGCLNFKDEKSFERSSSKMSFLEKSDTNFWLYAEHMILVLLEVWRTFAVHCWNGSNDLCRPFLSAIWRRFGAKILNHLAVSLCLFFSLFHDLLHFLIRKWSFRVSWTTQPILLRPWSRWDKQSPIPWWNRAKNKWFGTWLGYRTLKYVKWNSSEDWAWKENWCFGSWGRLSEVQHGDELLFMVQF